jgi:uncharacterized membrane protein
MSNTVATLRRRLAETQPRRYLPVMIEFISGLFLLGVWVVLQFVVRPTTGWIHVALAAGVILVIRGIARSQWGTPPSK